MENNVDFATIGASAPDTYTTTGLQGSGDLDYHPIAPKPAPPALAAAATNGSQDQAARLRALLSSHLSEGGAGGSQAMGADRLEALIDMLYAMTAPAAPAPVAEVAPAAAPIVAEEKPSLAPTAEAYAVTLPEPVRETPISDSISELANVEAAPAPAPAPIEAPTAQVIETASAPVEAPTAQVMETAVTPASQEVQNHAESSAPTPAPTPFTAAAEHAPTIVAEAQTVPHFAESEFIAAPQEEAISIEAHQPEAHQPEAYQPEAHPLDVSQPIEALQQIEAEAPPAEAPQIEARHTETPPLEAIPTEVQPEQTPQAEALLTEEQAVTDAAVAGETFPVSEPQASQEPTAFIEESPTVSAAGETLADDTKVQSRMSAVTEEVLTMDERVALLNPLKDLKEMKEERGATSGTVTFSFATDKSTATLSIPLQSNLSQITFEQRLDEIILKIHLSL